MNEYMAILNDTIGFLSEAYRLEAYWSLLDAAGVLLGGLIMMSAGWIAISRIERIDIHDSPRMFMAFILALIGVLCMACGFIYLIVPSHWATLYHPLEFLIAEKLF